MRKVFFLLFFLTITVLNVRADKWLLDVPQNSRVVLKPSHKFFNFQRWNVWTGRTSYTANISQFDGITTVNSDNNWKDVGWSLMEEFEVAKTSKNKDKIVVELRSGQANAKLYFDQSVKDINKAFRDVVYVGGLYEYKQSDYYLKEVEERFFTKDFLRIIWLISQ